MLVTFIFAIPEAVIAVGVPSGFVMLQERVVVQLLAPREMVQLEPESVPDIPTVTAQIVPFQVLPTAQVPTPAPAVVCASNTEL